MLLYGTQNETTIIEALVVKCQYEQIEGIDERI